MQKPPSLALAIPTSALAEVCRRYGVRRLSLFGSVLGDRFTPESDVDVLVEFEPDRTPGYIELGGLVVELSELFNRKVDLHTPKTLSSEFRDVVMKTASVQFAA